MFITCKTAREIGRACYRNRVDANTAAKIAEELAQNLGWASTTELPETSARIGWTSESENNRKLAKQ